jgi:hypothetical protein
LSIVTHDQALAKVMQWTTESGFEVSTVSESKNDFVIWISEKETLPSLQIIHFKEDTPFVLIVGLVNIPQSDREILKNLNLAQFEDFVWDIKLNLLPMGVDFTVLGSESDPDAWEIQKRLFLKETSTQDFHEAYSKVKNALISVIWSYKRALNRQHISL